MNDPMRHPPAQSLEALAHGELDASDRVVLESHILGCPHCEGRVDELRSLFHALASLPGLAPPAGFVDRIMASVRVPRPWLVRASDSLARVLPRTTTGWALAAAFLALPIIAGGTFFTWLLSKSYVTTRGLWVFVTDSITAAFQGLLSNALTFVIQSQAAAWLADSVGSIIEAAGIRGIGALAATVSVLILTSIWVLYTNLIRTPHHQDSTHGTFSF